MLVARIVFAAETLLVVAGLLWMAATVRTRTKVAGADRERFGQLQPTRQMLTAAGLSVASGWAISRHPVPDLLLLGLLGVVLPATAGMALALMIRQEEKPAGRGVRGWLVLAVPVLGGTAAGLVPNMF
ncbi:hypothetical protein [Streptomyces cucumeris]|uniref:hypothetical protein n=1 Tax=Streptomyces cucumeris TaxID=2962890 RepID=UPI0020C8487E|nr:hypothetical protein [Streptomyces sp. NEAU-Y11]MCP9213311.1 hypothetical protein [Streptomyces sp. NEAU-Y11]